MSNNFVVKDKDNYIKMLSNIPNNDMNIVVNALDTINAFYNNSRIPICAYQLLDNELFIYVITTFCENSIELIDKLILNKNALKYLNKYRSENNIEYVFEQINNKNYTVLPETIATNTVYKIHEEGSLDDDGYEKGFLFLPKGSGVNKHQHIDDVEQYTLIKGILSVKDEVQRENICLLYDEHNIDIVNEDTIVRTLKINKKVIMNDYDVLMKK